MFKLFGLSINATAIFSNSLVLNVLVALLDIKTVMRSYAAFGDISLFSVCHLCVLLPPFYCNGEIK